MPDLPISAGGRPAVQDQIHAYDLLLAGHRPSPEAVRDLLALGRVLDVEVVDTDPARIWAQLRPLVIAAGRGGRS